MTTKRMTAMVAAALMTACGADAMKGLEDPAPDDVATGAQALELDVRMKATNTEDYRTLLLRPVRIEARAGDRILPTRMDGEFVDLAQPDHAHRVGSVTVPADVTHVKVSVTFGDWGVYEGEGAGEIDARNLTLELDVPVDYVAKGKAVLSLDMARSLVPVRPDAMALVPVFRTLF